MEMINGTPYSSKEDSSGLETGFIVPGAIELEDTLAMSAAAADMGHSYTQQFEDEFASSWDFDSEDPESI